MPDQIIIKYAKLFKNLGKLASAMHAGRQEIAEYCEAQTIMHPWYSQRSFINEVFTYREYLDKMEEIEITEPIKK